FGLNFCLYGAVQYVNGPYEERIAAAIALACVVRLYPELTLKGVAKKMYEITECNGHRCFVDFKGMSASRLLADLLYEAEENISQDPENAEMLTKIFNFNDYGEKHNKHKKVLEVIKYAKKLYVVVENIENGKKYTDAEIAKLFGRKIG
ncbi:MAG: hypothetical protein ACHQU0_03810, partial [Candidatus Paceibacteria bacterium]